MAEIDTHMMEHIGVNTYQLMELAGYAVADAVRQRSDMQASREMVALAGSGGNGGDAMVAARFLAGWGFTCSVILTGPRTEYRGIAAHQLSALKALGISVRESDGSSDLPPADLIIDGLLGFSLRGNPRNEVARLIELANNAPAPVLAIDLPSGLNANTGKIGTPCIVADQTVTLALPKTGLMLAPESITGRITVADIGIPPIVYQHIGVEVSANIFANGNLVVIR